MNNKSSSDSESAPVTSTSNAEGGDSASQAHIAPAPPFGQPVNAGAEQPNPTESEEETDRKQDESIAMLADQTKWIAKQTKWIKYQVIAASFLGAVTLGVLVYHGWIMRRQSQAMMDQTAIMQGQLESMNSGSAQTQQMITATQQQADAAKTQAGTSQAIADQNKNLVSAALAQAEAARKGAEIAQQSFYIGDRPYVTAKNAELDKFEVETSPIIDILFINTGKTPAFELQLGAAVQIEKTPGPDIERLRKMSPAQLAALGATNSPYSFTMPQGSMGALPAGQETYGQARAPRLTPDLFEGIKSSKLFLVVWGFGSYKDGLGKLHRMRFCAFYIPSSDKFMECPAFNETEQQKN